MVYPYHRVIGLVLRRTIRRSSILDPLEEHVWTLRPGFRGHRPVSRGEQRSSLRLLRTGLAMTALRIGLFRWVRRTRSAFVVGGSSIRYRHRLRPWRRTEIRTRLVGFDSRLFYFQQRSIQGERVCSSALVRTGFAGRASSIPQRSSRASAWTSLHSWKRGCMIGISGTRSARCRWRPDRFKRSGAR